MEKEVNILVIDDEDIVCKSCYRVLSGAGYRVTTTTMGRDALKIAAAEYFDVAFIDIRMPNINGLSILGRLKVEQPEIEAIVITGYPSIDTIKEAVTLGASDYISKPLEPALLMKATSEALDRRRWCIHKYIIRNISCEEDIDGNNQCWLLYEGEGTVKIGLERKYIEFIGTPVYIDFPIEGEKIDTEQTLFKILTLEGKIYEIVTPLSGYVSKVNYDLIENISLLRDASYTDWAVQIDSAKTENS